MQRVKEILVSLVGDEVRHLHHHESVLRKPERAARFGATTRPATLPGYLDAVVEQTRARRRRPFVKEVANHRQRVPEQRVRAPVQPLLEASGHAVARLVMIAAASAHHVDTAAEHQR